MRSSTRAAIVTGVYGFGGIVPLVIGYDPELFGLLPNDGAMFRAVGVLVVFGVSMVLFHSTVRLIFSATEYVETRLDAIKASKHRT